MNQPTNQNSSMPIGEEELSETRRVLREGQSKLVEACKRLREGGAVGLVPSDPTEEKVFDYLNLTIELVRRNNSKVDTIACHKNIASACRKYAEYHGLKCVVSPYLVEGDYVVYCDAVP